MNSRATSRITFISILSTMESLVGSNLNFYKELYNVEATIHYKNTTEFKRAWDNTFENMWERDSLGDHTILILGFPNDIFDDDNDSDDYYNPFLRAGKILLLQDINAILFTMPSTIHEMGAEIFHDLLSDKLKEMNCYWELEPTGRALQKLHGVSKEPDKSYELKRNNHLTFVVEVGVSESNRALTNDAKIWLEHFESHVAQVLVIAMSRKREVVSFILWHTAHEERGTRANQPLLAAIVQRVEVTLDEGRPMANGRIILSFEKLFERKPRQGTADDNIVLSRRELGGISRRLWERLGILPLPSLPS